MSDKITARYPDQQFNIDLWVMSRYVESCFAAVGREQPKAWHEAWGAVCHMILRGEVAPMQEWAQHAGIDVIGYDPEQASSIGESRQAMLDKRAALQGVSGGNNS